MVDANTLTRLASNVRGMTVEYRSITGEYSTGVMDDDDLRGEIGFLSGCVVFAIAKRYIAMLYCFNGDVLDVKTHVAASESFFDRFVMHFDRLDFSCDSGRGKCHDHSRF